METLEDLGVLLRWLRRRQARSGGGPALTYRELAAQTGWSKAVIGEYLNGKTLPPTERFDELVRALGAAVDEVGALCTARDRVEERRWRAGQSQPPVQATASTGRPWQVPRELPADVVAFTGRDGELAALDRCADPVVVICGTAGVGKTALAVHWAHRTADRFPDGQLFLDLRGYHENAPVPPPAALASLLHRMGVSEAQLPADTEGRAARLRTLVAGRKMLIVLDNAHAAEQVRPLLPGSPSCQVVVTSRDDLAGLVARDGAHRIGVDLFTPAESVDLLRRLLGDRAGATPRDAARLADQCARLPLALRVAAELAVTRAGSSLAELNEELAEQERRLDILDGGGDVHSEVRAVLGWSHRNLRPSAARVFALLGLYPGYDFTDRTVAELAGQHDNTGPGQALRPLRELARAHLIQPTTRGRYTMHDLLRAYSRERSGLDLSPEQRREARLRILDHYRHSAALAATALFPHEPVPGVPSPAVRTTPAPASDWLDVERSNLVAVAGYARRHGYPEHSIDLSLALTRYLEVGGHYQDALVVHSHALAACQDGQPARAADILLRVAMTCHRLGRPHDAFRHASQALALYRKQADHAGTARTLGNLGLLYRQLGRYRDALSHHQQALALHRRAGNPRREAMQLANIGLLLARLGHAHQAAAHHHAAIVLFTDLDDARSIASALANLALLHVQRGRYALASGILERTLPLARRFGDRNEEAEQLTTQGQIAHGRGRYRQALQEFQHAIDLGTDMGSRLIQAQALNHLGRTQRAMGHLDPAETSHQQALTLAQRLAEPYQQARALDGTAEVYSARSETDRAHGYWSRALHLYRELDLPEARKVVARLARLR